MISEIDLLRADIPRLEQKFGVGNPFVELLKAQLASLQDQTEKQTRSERHSQGFKKFKGSQILKSNEASNKRV